jgi:hypothetical protein
MRLPKLLTVVGSVVLVLGLSGAAWGTSRPSSREPTVKITGSTLKRAGYNQAHYANVKATHFPPDTRVDFMECAAPTQSDPNMCNDDSGSSGDGTTNAQGAITFHRIVLLGGGYYSDPDSDSCGTAGETPACYVTVDLDSSPDVGASKAYNSYCTHFQGYRCFPGRH